MCQHQNGNQAGPLPRLREAAGGLQPTPRDPANNARCPVLSAASDGRISRGSAPAPGSVLPAGELSGCGEAGLTGPQVDDRVCGWVSGQPTLRHTQKLPPGPGQATWQCHRSGVQTAFPGGGDFADPASSAPGQRPPSRTRCSGGERKLSKGKVGPGASRAVWGQAGGEQEQGPVPRRADPRDLALHTPPPPSTRPPRAARSPASRMHPSPTSRERVGGWKRSFLH